MSIDGTYGFVYFLVVAGEFRGSDLGGARYVGTGKENHDGAVTLATSVEVPAGSATAPPN